LVLSRIVGCALLASLLWLTGWAPALAEAVLPATRSWPLAGPVRVLREFDPPAVRWGRGHRGVDLAAAVGQPVLAAAAGTISFAGRVAGRGVVVVRHGLLRTTYEPVRAAVVAGERVAAGTVIGMLTSGSHCGARSCLHWGLIEGAQRYRDPLLLAPLAAGVRLLAANRGEVARARAAVRAAAAAEAARQIAAVPQAFVGATGRGGFGHPVPGPITSPFGMRFHPVLHRWKLHDGTDFGAPCGTPIRAPAAGRVAGRSYSGGYGNRLMLDHGRVAGRRVVTGYNHATRYVVGRGATVRRGQLLGYVGSTGYSTGCHLHLMVWLDSRLSNPMTWFRP
jgi:murein DD-endopeptidase MepM/ murein hydrolase activator NlpD